MVARHRAVLDGRSGSDRSRATGGVLFDELIRPLLPGLSASPVLIVVADGALQTVPFASLFDANTGRYLVQDYILGLAPSGTVFVRASAAASVGGQWKKAVVLGNPRSPDLDAEGLTELPSAEAEAADVAGLYPTARLLTRERATTLALEDGIRSSDVVHFAGHAGRSPGGASGWLWLATGPSIGLDEKARFSDLRRTGAPRARVVVLSACGTAAGPLSSTEGALSIARPFLAAGVPSVVSSLWDVDDAASRRFFARYHRKLIEIREPILALRATQLSFLDSDADDRAPTHWAAFVGLGGIDRRRVPTHQPL
jgi:CHAT domain-containing protein